MTVASIFACYYPACGAITGSALWEVTTPFMPSRSFSTASCTAARAALVLWIWHLYSMSPSFRAIVAFRVARFEGQILVRMGHTEQRL